ncbi:MAG: serine/threonine-protein phosphatase [Candidatus Dadabacteria bacterium]|nr:MAG: serine/threonine-protein phosphatase [Candidatus Dadabacteria bacterium]
MDSGSTLLINCIRHVGLDAAGPGRVAYVSMKRPDQNASRNEDSLCIISVNDSCVVLGLSDGFGGCRGGDQASKIAVETLSTVVDGIVDSENGLRGEILNSFEEANRKILELGIGAATTFIAAEVTQNMLRVYHVGDSAGLLVTQRGTVKFQTTSHSPVGYAVESGVLDEREAMYHEQRHIVSNMLGSEDMHIEVGPRIELSKKDTFLIASDGLFDNLHLNEITNIIRSGPLEEAANELLEKTEQRMLNPSDGDPSKPDDLTFALFRLGR